MAGFALVACLTQAGGLREVFIGLEEAPEEIEESREKVEHGGASRVQQQHGHENAQEEKDKAAELAGATAFAV